MHARRGGPRRRFPGDGFPGNGAGAGCCTASGAGFRDVAQALRAGRAFAAYLNSPAAGDLEGPARGEALEQLGRSPRCSAPPRNGLLRRFDADDGHDADGYATAAAWLAARTSLGRQDARAAVRQMRLLARHPVLDAATATGAVTISWAREIAGWTGRIGHQELQSQADKILLEAATAGADLDDLRLLAQAAYEAWRAREPDPDEDPAGRGFGDRDLRLQTTMDGAGRIRGDLTPECAAAVTAVIEALGKPRGPEDLRSPGQRCHDALQEGCAPLWASGWSSWMQACRDGRRLSFKVWTRLTVTGLRRLVTSGRMRSRKGWTCCGGPSSGAVHLPSHLDWSGNAVYDLEAPGRVVDLYRAVLIEAASPQDLYAYLDEGVLRRLWVLLWLPAQLRGAWEQRFPVLAEISRITAAA